MDNQCRERESRTTLVWRGCNSTKTDEHFRWARAYNSSSGDNGDTGDAEDDDIEQSGGDDNYDDEGYY